MPGEADSELIAKVAKEIKQSGYPLELKTSAILESRGWTVYNNPVYLDPDEERLREYDLSASKFSGVKPPYDKEGLPGLEILRRGHVFLVSLMVECKRSETPWVFFMRPVGPSPGMRLHIESMIADLVPTLPDSQAVFTHAQLSSALWYSRYNERARSFFEPFKRNRQPGQIWTAFMQIAKATCYAEEKFRETELETLTSWMVPLVVFEGTLLKAYVVGDEVDIAETDHVAMEFDYVSKSNPTGTSQFLIDVVRRDYLETFSLGVESAFASLSSVLHTAFSTNRITFRKDPVVQ